MTRKKIEIAVVVIEISRDGSRLPGDCFFAVGTAREQSLLGKLLVRGKVGKYFSLHIFFITAHHTLHAVAGNFELRLHRGAKKKKEKIKK